MKTPGTPTIIHIFAFLHAAVAYTCNSLGIADTLLLTVLTMIMAIAICLRKGLSTEFTAANVIVVNVLGFVFGTVGASFFGRLIPSSNWTHAVSSLVTTEILGWGIILITNIFKKNDTTGETGTFGKRLMWITVATAIIVGIRLGVTAIFRSGMFGENEINKVLSEVFSNSAILISIICLCIICVRYLERFRLRRNYKYRILVFIVFCAVTSAAAAALYESGFPFEMRTSLTSDMFLKFFTIYALVTVTIYCLVFMINYAFATKAAMRIEKEKAHLAQYHYIKLKQQLNPHFLFNCLNILDCLVVEKQNSQASTYIHKLSGVYRYMLKHEDERIVKVEEELDFLGQYADLLHVRFPEGFTIDIDVDKPDRDMHILPCALQLALENAIKHNAINGDNSLAIRIESNGDTISVRNNIIPKMTKPTSNGVGQKYLKQQYLDLCKREVKFENTGSEYIVTIPLIKEHRL